MKDKENNEKSLINQNKKFGYIVSRVSLLLAGYRVFGRNQPWWCILLGIGLLLLVITLVAPGRLSALRSLWEKLGHVMGIVNTYVLLTLFYFFILTPLGLVMRLFGQDILKLKWQPKQSTYWEANQPAAESRMEDQF
jgi:hypothetical protein